MIKDAHLKIVEACREASGALTSSANKLENVETILKQHEPMTIV